MRAREVSLWDLKSAPEGMTGFIRYALSRRSY